MHIYVNKMILIKCKGDGEQRQPLRLTDTPSPDHSRSPPSLPQMNQIISILTQVQGSESSECEALTAQTPRGPSLRG